MMSNCFCQVYNQSTVMAHLFYSPSIADGGGDVTGLPEHLAPE